MTVKDQFKKLKDNWLLILLPFVLIFILVIGFSGITILTDTFSSYGGSSSDSYQRPSIGYSSANYEAASMATRFSLSKASPTPSNDVVLPKADRMIAKTASMQSKVDRGKFLDSENSLKNIVKSSSGFILDQNVETYGKDRDAYEAGRYQIKIDSKKYDSVVSQLKAIGKNEVFVENAQDVTQAHTDLNVQLETEKGRLARYQEMYKNATVTEDKILISDRIFSQENTIKYLEESLKNVDNQVVYSTVDVTLTEMKSDYSDLGFASFSSLVISFVGSLSALVVILVALLPWILVIWLIVFVVRKIRNRNKRR